MDNPSNNQKHISEFMLSEYEHISEAHFESGKSITSFFRYYLLIMSAPAFVFLFLDKDITKLDALLKGDDIGFNGFISIFFGIIATVGFGIGVYIIDKKMQVILYARTVNGIRKYFKETAGEPVDSYLVLPTDVFKPTYFSWRSLFSIIIPVALINSSLLLFAFWVSNFKCLAIVFANVFFIIHVGIYSIIALTQKNSVR